MKESRKIEQKSTDKIGPKFSGGDWVVTDKNSVVQIKAIENGKYVLENTMRFSVDYVDKCWRKWDISDANKSKVMKANKVIKSGIELIAEERQRQINVEGYSAQHDSQHKASEFAYAIIAYAEAAKAGINCRESGITDERYISMAKSDMGRHFPWGEFKTTTDIRDLIKVGALAAALIDRLQTE